MAEELVREAVGVFHSVEDMEAAIDDLLTSGFDRAEISLLASEDTLREKLGKTVTSTREYEDQSGVPSVPYLARESFGSLEGYSIGLPLYVGAIVGFVPVLASGGAIAAAIAAAVIGAGGGAAIGSVLATLIDRHHAEFLASQLQHGGILIWVRTRDGEHERRATEILSRHSGLDVHVHGLPDRSADLQEHYAAAKAKAPGSDMRHVEYQDVQIAIAPDGHCLALGRLFASEAEARRYVDKVQSEA